VKFRVALSIVALAVGSGVATDTAKAHFLYHKKKLSLEAKVKFFERSITHERNAIRWLRKARKNVWHTLGRVTYSEGVNRKERVDYAGRVYDEIQFHRRALRWHTRLLRRYGAKLEAERAWSALPPHYDEWQCIHGYEGSWTDPNPPYFGGLQMDLEFQQAYGPELLRKKGTADNWTPLEQMWVAEKAHRDSGFHPWPNTARYCGLL
jgi:hypothetical protein